MVAAMHILALPLEITREYFGVMLLEFMEHVKFCKLGHVTIPVGYTYHCLGTMRLGVKPYPVVGDCYTVTVSTALGLKALYVFELKKVAGGYEKIRVTKRKRVSGRFVLDLPRIKLNPDFTVKSVEFPRTKPRHRGFAG